MFHDREHLKIFQIDVKNAENNKNLIENVVDL